MSKRLKPDRLSHLSGGTSFPTPAQKRAYAEHERRTTPKTKTMPTNVKDISYVSKSQFLYQVSQLPDHTKIFNYRICSTWIGEDNGEIGHQKVEFNKGCTTIPKSPNKRNFVREEMADNPALRADIYFTHKVRSYSDLDAVLASGLAAFYRDESSLYVDVSEDDSKKDLQLLAGILGCEPPKALIHLYK